MADDLDQRLLQFVEVERIGVAQVKGRLAVLELQPKDSLMLVFVESDAEGHLPVQTQQIRSATGRPVERSVRSEEHTSELQSLMRISYAVFCLKKKTTYTQAAPNE